MAEAHKQDWQEQPHEKAFQVFKQDNAGPNGEPLYTVHGRNGEEIAKFHDQKQADRWASLHRNAWLKKVQTANEAAQQQPQQPQQPQKPTVKPPPVVNTPEQRAKWQRRYQNMAQRMLGLPFLHGARIHATPEGVTIARPDGHVVRARYARKGELEQVARERGENLATGGPPVAFYDPRAKQMVLSRDFSSDEVGHEYVHFLQDARVLKPHDVALFGGFEPMAHAYQHWLRQGRPHRSGGILHKILDFIRSMQGDPHAIARRTLRRIDTGKPRGLGAKLDTFTNRMRGLGEAIDPHRQRTI